MPTFQFEAMDATGQEIKDIIEAASEEEAQTTIRQMGYFVTKIQVKKGAAKTAAGQKKKRPFAIGGAKTKHICAFTRQLSILQDAGLPILRSSEDPGEQQQAGQAQECLDGYLRRNRNRFDAIGGDEQVAQGLQSTVREHDQGR